MDTIVKVLNEKVENGDAKTIVEALKQIDTSAEGDTVAEVLKNMNLGGGGGSSSGVPVCTVRYMSADGAEKSISFNSGGFELPTYFLNPNASYGIYQSAFTVTFTDTTTLKYLYVEENSSWKVNAKRPSEYNIEYSDLVNIDSNLTIIDPSKDSSVTIKLSAK